MMRDVGLQVPLDAKLEDLSPISASEAEKKRLKGAAFLILDISVTSYIYIHML